MQKLLLVLMFFIGISAGAQFQLKEKKGYYGVVNEKGKVLLKPKFDTVFISTSTESSLVIVSSLGEKFLYDLSSKPEVKNYSIRFTAMQFLYWGGPDVTIEAQDELGNVHFYENGAWWTRPYLKVVRQAGLGFNGLYALTDSTKAFTKYEFKYIEPLSDLAYTAWTDSGKIALDTMGKILTNYTFDYARSNYKDKEAFVYYKGDLWGFFSADKIHGIPPSLMDDPESVFNMDGDSYADLDKNYVIKKNGKYGIISAKNEVLWPCGFNQIIQADYVGSYAGIIDGEWWVLPAGSEETIKVNCDRFITVRDGYVVYLKNGNLNYIDIKTKVVKTEVMLGEKEDWELFQSNLSFHDYRFLEGAVDEKGSMLLPFEYANITFHAETDFNYFILQDTLDKYGLADEKGKVILPPKFDRLVEMCTYDDKYFKLKKDGKCALGRLNKDLMNFEILTGFDYEAIYFGRTESSSNHTAIKKGQNVVFYLDEVGNILPPKQK